MFVVKSLEEGGIYILLMWGSEPWLSKAGQLALPYRIRRTLLVIGDITLFLID